MDLLWIGVAIGFVLGALTEGAIREVVHELVVRHGWR